MNITPIILRSATAKVVITDTDIHASKCGPMEWIGRIEAVAHGFKVVVYTVTYEPLFSSREEAMRYCVDSVFTRMIEEV